MIQNCSNENKGNLGEKSCEYYPYQTAYRWNNNQKSSIVGKKGEKCITKDQYSAKDFRPLMNYFLKRPYLFLLEQVAVPSHLLLSN